MSRGRFASLLHPAGLSLPPDKLAARGRQILDMPTDIASNVGAGVAARRGGRPSRLQTVELQQTILDVATELFLTRGYGATSIEAVAAAARISKRTFYHRFRDKAALFEAAVRRLIERWLPPFEARLLENAPPDLLLHGLAAQILAIALSPPALALHRVLIAEAQRFPELVQLVNEAGAGKGVERIAALLERERQAGRLRIADSRFAAEQFLNMVLSGPQKRALGFGRPLEAEEIEAWIRDTVALFLDGSRGAATAS
jgi:TetR/AcrR family transcriptional repressor of mexJK operon